MQQSVLLFDAPVTLPPHELPPLQSTMHADVALHVTLSQHESYPLHATAHELLVQSTFLPHESVFSQSTVHAAAVHVTSSLHEA